MVAVLLVLYPEIGIGDVAVKDVLTIFTVGFEIRGLDLLADKVDIARCHVLFDEAQVALKHFRRQLFALQRLLEYIQQMHRIGGDLGTVKVEYFGKDLERETGREPLHALIDARRVAILLNRLGPRIGVF